MNWSDQHIDNLLAKTETLANSKKGQSCLVFSGSYLANHFNYYKYLDYPNIDLIGHNLCWMLPGAEKFTFMLHGSRGYTNAYSKTCTTFNAFCQRFEGHHLFCMDTRHWPNTYPLPSKKDTIETIQKHNIKNYYVFTQENAKQSLSYVARSTDDYKLSKIPAGCGGTLNAITIPFILKLGYKKIYIVGIGDQYLHHFYDSEILFRYGVQPPKRTLNHRDASLERYRKLVRCAENSGSEIYVVPGSLTEPSISKIFKTAETI